MIDLYKCSERVINSGLHCPSPLCTPLGGGVRRVIVPHGTTARLIWFTQAIERDSKRIIESVQIRISSRCAYLQHFVARMPLEIGDRRHFYAFSNLVLIQHGFGVRSFLLSPDKNAEGPRAQLRMPKKRKRDQCPQETWRRRGELDWRE